MSIFLSIYFKYSHNINSVKLSMLKMILQKMEQKYDITGTIIMKQLNNTYTAEIPM